MVSDIDGRRNSGLLALVNGQDPTYCGMNASALTGEQFGQNTSLDTA